MSMLWVCGTGVIGILLMAATYLDEDVKPLNATIILAVWPALLVVFVAAGAVDLLEIMAGRR